VIAPTLAYKVTPNHSFGISPLIAFQRFKIEGAQGFSGFSTSPANLTNNGHDNSHGFGVRLGWFGKLSDSVSLGAAYSTKISMSEFDKYKGLFAEQGGFDIPVNYNFGVAYKATPKLTVAADYQRINYSGVKSVGNPSSNLAGCFGGNVANCLGGSAGAGFGWRDINVVKVGFEYEYSQRLTLRAGYDRSQNPIRSSDVTINILAPGIVQDHLTFGLTHKTSTGGELTVSYMHAFSKTVSGPSFFNGFTAPLSSGSETIKMHQDSIGIAYGWKM
jgi:long-chain fatty acid transport protein